MTQWMTQRMNPMANRESADLKAPRKQIHLILKGAQINPFHCLLIHGQGNEECDFLPDA
jgi:hypothetical protein